MVKTREEKMARLVETGVISPAEADEALSPWLHCWRVGFAPVLSTAGLTALAEALETDNPELMQGRTVEPPPLLALAEFQVCGACALSYCGWKGEGLNTVGEVEEEFSRVCLQAENAFDERGSCRYFINWFDDTPRAEMRAALLPEVRAELDRRAAK